MTHLTLHAEGRFTQRGIRQSELDLIKRYATETDDGLYMGKAAVQAALSELRRQCEAIMRLEGVLLIMKGNAVVTGYRTTKRQDRLQRQRCRR